MKYIKTYESHKKINENDYVVIINTLSYEKIKKYDLGKVIEKNTKIFYTEYLVKIDHLDFLFRFFDDDIRLATQEDIEEYEIEQSTNKYNI